MFAGIGTHKDTLAVAVIEETGLLVAAREVPNAEQGFVQLVGLFDTHQVVRVGIEGSGNFGRAVAIHLLMCWLSGWSVAVVKVPTLKPHVSVAASSPRAKLTRLTREPVPGSPCMNRNCRQSA